MFSHIDYLLNNLRWFLLSMLVLYPACGASPLHKPPQIVKELSKKVELKLGSFNRFSLECRGDADPPPTYHWYRNNENLSSDSLASQGIQLVTNNQYSQLHFPTPTPQHEG
jgi:hypothetical protein